MCGKGPIFIKLYVDFESPKTIPFATLFWVFYWREMTTTLNGFCGSENVMEWRAIRKILCDWKSAARDAFSPPLGDVKMAWKGCLLHWRKVFASKVIIPFMDPESGWKASEKGSPWEIDSFLTTFRSLSGSVKSNICSKAFLQRKRNSFQAISTSWKGKEKVYREYSPFVIFGPPKDCSTMTLRPREECQ